MIDDILTTEILTEPAYDYTEILIKLDDISLNQQNVLSTIEVFSNNFLIGIGLIAGCIFLKHFSFWKW